ncbi:VPLPA-CTERM sorting domain-containing protein [Gammaproteobacteria bacterium]|nr:VPLPA-CTERM sorting domain-containing protein [Gammaproteobacteria bacterium]
MPVLAVPVTWTLNNVVYDDGGIVTGSFDYDAEFEFYSNINIQSPEHWEGDWFWAEQSFIDVGQYGPAATETRFHNPGCGYCENDPDTVITFKFATALTNSGGTVSLIPNVSFLSPGFAEPGGPFWGLPDMSSGMDRKIVSGTISTVPIPAAAWLFGSTLVGLGWMRRKQLA